MTNRCRLPSGTFLIQLKIALQPRCILPVSPLYRDGMPGMLYAYTQRLFNRNKPGTWSTFSDPAISGVIPAAALAFRQQHIRQACRTYCLKLSKEELFYKQNRSNHKCGFKNIGRKIETDYWNAANRRTPPGYKRQCRQIR